MHNNSIPITEWVNWFKADHGHIYADTVLNDKFKAMMAFLRTCLVANNYKDRPNCQQFLEAMNEWSVSADLVREEFKNQRSNLDGYDFFLNYLNFRLNTINKN